MVWVLTEGWNSIGWCGYCQGVGLELGSLATDRWLEYCRVVGLLTGS